MRTDTPGWLGLLSAFSPLRLLPLMLMAMSLVSAARADVSQAPHWEDFDGASRYGYWESPYAEAGYWDDGAGYWDYSAGLGHYVVRYSNGRWEADQDGVVSFFEDAETVWVEDPVWVSVPQYVYYQPTWVDCPYVVGNPDDARVHSIDLDISIRDPEPMPGRKAWAHLEWRVDGDGTVTEISRISGVGSTPLIPGVLELPGGGDSLIDGQPGPAVASIRLYGRAWSNLNFFGLFSDAAIDWDLRVNMSYGGVSPLVGVIIGTHDHYPSFLLTVDSLPAYEHVQEPTGVLGAAAIDTDEYGFVVVDRFFGL